MAPPPSLDPPGWLPPLLLHSLLPLLLASAAAICAKKRSQASASNSSMRKPDSTDVNQNDSGNGEVCGTVNKIGSKVKEEHQREKKCPKALHPRKIAPKSAEEMAIQTEIGRGKVRQAVENETVEEESGSWGKRQAIRPKLQPTQTRDLPSKSALPPSAQFAHTPVDHTQYTRGSKDKRDPSPSEKEKDKENSRKNDKESTKEQQSKEKDKEKEKEKEKKEEKKKPRKGSKEQSRSKEKSKKGDEIIGVDKTQQHSVIERTKTKKKKNIKIHADKTVDRTQDISAAAKKK